MLHTLHTLHVVLSPVKGYIKRLARLQANEPCRKEILENSLPSLGGEVHFPRQWYGIPVAIVNEYIWQCFCILLQFVPCQRARSSSPPSPTLQLRVLIKIEILFGFYVQTFCTLSFGSHNGGTLHSLRVNLCVNFPNEPEANPFWGVATGVACDGRRGVWELGLAGRWERVIEIAFKCFGRRPRHVSKNAKAKGRGNVKLRWNSN